MTMTLSMESALEKARGTALYPPKVVPPAKPLGRLGFMASFVQNPLNSLPQSVYEEDFVAYENGPAPLIWITEPSLIKTVLLDKREKFPKTTQIRLLGPLLGKGILTSDGQEWKWQRQTSAPIFRHQDLLAMVPGITKCAEDMVAEWRAAGGGARAVDKDMTKVTFDVISATLLPSGDGHVAPAIEGAAGKFQQGTAWALLYNLLKVPHWMPRPGRGSGNEAIRTLRSSTAKLIAERRAMQDRPDDLMQRLMDAKSPDTGELMSDEQLIDNLLTFYLAGHETTAKALTWTLYLLARAPEWEALLADEVERVTGGASVGPEHIDKLVLTTQVIKESMRLFPPAPMMSRVAGEDIDVGGHKVPKGSQVIVPIYAIQRHRKRWEDPDRFDPTRFAPDKEAKISRYQYMPFGAGPRICIGMAFAQIEATAILATLVRAARFAARPGLAPVPLARVTLVPKGGMPLTVTMRDAAKVAKAA
jgi:cytochrome P450